MCNCGAVTHKKAVNNKLYIQFPDETWEQAIEAHAVGFDTVEEALEEGKVIMAEEPKLKGFEVKDHTGQTVKKFENLDG